MGQKFLERWYGDGCPPWTWPVTVVVFLLVMGYAAVWNEYDSPWGRDVQAAKIAHLKPTLCK